MVQAQMVVISFEVESDWTRPGIPCPVRGRMIAKDGERTLVVTVEAPKAALAPGPEQDAVRADCVHLLTQHFKKPYDDSKPRPVSPFNFTRT